MLTQVEVKQWFNYDPASGILTWRRTGMRAGTKLYRRGKPSIRQVMLSGKAYNETAVIWLWVTGSLPTLRVDHIDLNPFNNSWSNLREADNSQNQANRRNSRPGQLKWAYLHENGRYRSRVVFRGVRYDCGYYDTEQDAHDAAYAVAQQLHGSFVRR